MLEMADGSASTLNTPGFAQKSRSNPGRSQAAPPLQPLPETEPRTRETKNAKLLTDLGIQRLNGRAQLDRINSEREKQGLRPINQFLIWDTAQKGLALLVGARTKTFRAQFKLNDQWLT